MERIHRAKIGKEFRPSLQLKKLYYTYFISIAVIFIFPWLIPMLLFGMFMINLFISVPILFILIFTAYWINKYYFTMIYKLSGNEMIWRRGVWFKKTGVVPYNRITNIDIAQGPVSRKFGIASLKIQTAGYSAPTARSSEIKIEGMEDFEEIRELIMGFVSGKKPVAVETYEEEDVSPNVLNELVKIRKLLEKSQR